MCRAGLILCVASLPTAAAAQWVQLGSDLDGEVAADECGWSVSLSADGSRMAVGSPSHHGTAAYYIGHVRVFEWNGTSWVQLGPEIEGEAGLDYSGYAVSMSADGSRVVIGARGNDGTDEWAGHARVYQWLNPSWHQVGLDLDGEVHHDEYGRTVALSPDGSRVAVGTPYNDGNGSNSGHVRVFEWGNLNWEQMGVDIDGEAAEDYSGESVALSADGSRVAIGAPRNDGNGYDSGHVRVFEWAGSSWVQVGSDIDGEAAWDNSGASVALSTDGSRVAIGASGNDGGGDNAGHVRVFEWVSPSWVQIGSDIDGEASGDQSGSSISLSTDGARVAIGARKNNGGGFWSGHVRVFEWGGSGWVQMGSDIDGEAANDESGWSVASSADGRQIAIGAPQNNGNGDGSGHARVFEFTLVFADGFESSDTSAWSVVVQ
jgi:hypothetical protein